MNRKSIRIFAALGLLVAASLSLLAQGGPGYGRGMRGNGQCPACQAAPAPTQPLTADETKWLLFMREEEKLARDVYTALYETSKLNVFRNIARSEQRHFDSVGLLLERYGVSEPVNSQPEVFTNATLQTLYSKLVADGTTSPAAALKAGVTIEEQDIADLEAAIAATRKTDIKRVYTNLLSGSLNHLEAFQRQLEMAGVEP
ncbi:MAG: DUF2202 domain-containing protein [Bryobacteraceae bacterium]